MKTVTTTEMTCCHCGTTFAMDEVLRELRRKDGDKFFCPNGHPQHYDDSYASRLAEKTAELETLRGELRDAKTEITRLRCELMKVPEKGLRRFFSR